MGFGPYATPVYYDRIRLFEDQHDTDVPMTDEVFQTFQKLQDDRDPKPGDAVFVRRYGHAWKSWQGACQGAAKRASIRDFRFHDLRHTFASWLARAGVVEKARADLTGHSPAMQARYRHLSVDYQRAAVAKLPLIGDLAAEAPLNPPSAREAKVVSIAR